MRRLRDASAPEMGFTIIEVLVAALVLVLGALAVFGVLAAATVNTQRAKGTQIALDRAEQEVEALRSLKDEQLAMTEVPPYSANSLNPNHRVNASNGTFALTREPLGRYATMVHNGGNIEGKTGEEALIKGGVVNPGPTSFTSGDVKGKIYRYVVWRNDAACGSACPYSQDYKQIIVAVRLEKAGNEAATRGYVEVQANFVNPARNPETEAIKAGGTGGNTAQQFFLSDTPCSATPPTVRREITGDHLLHNTLGTCASGAQVEGTKGAPDALLLGAPPTLEESVPPLYDYSDDPYLEPTVNPESDKGIQIPPDGTASGCLYNPEKETASTHPQSQVHRWVTDPFVAGFTLTGKITIEFYTLTINEARQKGTLCVFLFKRHETGSPPVAEDALLLNSATNKAYWTYTPPATAENPNGYWPYSQWGKVRLTMNFNSPPYTIEKGDRLGVALSVDHASTPAAIQIMYDHPQYPTRIEVDTNTPIGSGG